MLILTRKAKESIVINGNIEVTIISADRNQVKLGILAPKNISVHRKEVFEAIQQENIAAAASEFSDLGTLGKLFKGSSTASYAETPQAVKKTKK